MGNVIDTPGFFDTSLTLDAIQKRLAVVGNHSPRGLSAILIVTSGRATEQNQKVLNYVKQQFGDAALNKYAILLFTHSSKTSCQLSEEIQVLPDDNEYKKMMSTIPRQRLLSIDNGGWWWSKRSQRQHILDTVNEMRAKAEEANPGKALLDCEGFRQHRIKSSEEVDKKERCR